MAGEPLREIRGSNTVFVTSCVHWLQKETLPEGDASRALDANRIGNRFLPPSTVPKLKEPQASLPRLQFPIHSPGFSSQRTRARTQRPCCSAVSQPSSDTRCSATRTALYVLRTVSVWRKEQGNTCTQPGRGVPSR